VKSDVTRMTNSRMSKVVVTDNEYRLTRWIVHHLNC
jgi:hypothetical protein